MNPRIVFMGTPDFAVSSLRALHEEKYNIVGVVTVPDKPSGRGLKIMYSPVKKYALEHNLHVLQPEKLRNEVFLSELEKLNADIFIVVAFRMLPQVVWQMPHLGTFNLHASLLPQYRGAAPINWAIINGEVETGVTTFLLNERIDEGEILLQQKIQIMPTDTVETLHNRLASIGNNLVIETVKGLANKTLIPQKQANGGILLNPAPKIFKSDCFIDWTQKGSEIVNFVRGLSPYPAAVMELKTSDNSKTLSFKVYDVSFEHAENTICNKIYTDNTSFFKIGIPDGYIAINHLQLSGKQRNHIRDFLRGNNISNYKLAK